MKRKKDDEMAATAVRLPQSLHERLKKAGGERGMGEEIRRRLEASFDAEAASANPKTAELAGAVIYCADQTALFYGDWSKDAFAFEVLKACVDMLLTYHHPEGTAVPHPIAGSSAEAYFGPEHSPKDASRLFLNAWQSKADLVVANPPFGNKKSGGRPTIRSSARTEVQKRFDAIAEEVADDGK